MECEDPLSDLEGFVRLSDLKVSGKSNQERAEMIINQIKSVEIPTEPCKGSRQPTKRIGSKSQRCK